MDGLFFCSSFSAPLGNTGRNLRDTLKILEKQKLSSDGSSRGLATPLPYNFEKFNV